MVHIQASASGGIPRKPRDTELDVFGVTHIGKVRTQNQDHFLIAAGVIRRSDPGHDRWKHVLSSAIGGPEASPVVTAIENDWHHVHLLRGDGLPKHLSDEQIAERLRTMTSSQQVCEILLQDALVAGGTDNITIIVGRAVPQAGS